MLGTERLGQKASENDKFSANCANTSRALVQHLSSEKEMELSHLSVFGTLNIYILNTGHQIMVQTRYKHFFYYLK